MAGLGGSTSNFSVFVQSAQTGTAGDNLVSGTIGAADTGGLSLGSISLANSTAARSAVTSIQSAVSALGGVQASVGALENKLQFAISLNHSMEVNGKAAESRIRDANIAEESANMTRYSILNQSGIAALAQANQQSSAVLSLLR